MKHKGLIALIVAAAASAVLFTFSGCGRYSKPNQEPSSFPGSGYSVCRTDKGSLQMLYFTTQGHKCVEEAVAYQIWGYYTNRENPLELTGENKEKIKKNRAMVARETHLAVKYVYKTFGTNIRPKDIICIRLPK